MEVERDEDDVHVEVASTIDEMMVLLEQQQQDEHQREHNRQCELYAQQFAAGCIGLAVAAAARQEEAAASASISEEPGSAALVAQVEAQEDDLSPPLGPQPLEQCHQHRDYIIIYRASDMSEAGS